MLVNSYATWRGRPVTALLFDLDGTLIESLGDLRSALNKTLQELRLAPLDDAAVARMVGDGIPKLVERGLAARNRDFTNDELAKAIDLFMKAYEARPADESYLYPGVAMCLERFQSAGLAMAVCTNKAESMTKLVLERLAISSYFSCIVGGDTLVQRKPAPEPVLACLKSLGVSEKEALFIGDSRNDVLAARSCGLPVVLIPSGYGSDAPQDLDADNLLESFEDLAKLLLSQ